MITQPTFFPWLGYFDMISQSDKLIFLDDVNFDYQSWQHRNYFKTPIGLKLFSIPVKNGKKKIFINQQKFLYSPFLKKKFFNFIISNYSKAKYFRMIREDFFHYFEKALVSENLLDLNVDIIKWFLKYLKIEKPIIYSSSLNIKSKKTKKIIEICKKLHATEYLSTTGAKDYLENDKDLFKNENIKLIFHKYNHPTYNQLFGAFIPFAGIIDLIINEGEKSFDIIKSGRF